MFEVLVTTVSGDVSEKESADTLTLSLYSVLHSVGQQNSSHLTEHPLITQP